MKTLLLSLLLTMTCISYASDEEINPPVITKLCVIPESGGFEYLPESHTLIFSVVRCEDHQRVYWKVLIDGKPQQAKEYPL